MTPLAALYLRSSKDRKDVSIQDQRRKLQEIADSRGFRIVAEFVDVVESGKDEDRPGFQKLLTAIRAGRTRGWDQLMLLDTARLARRRVIAVIFEEQECARHGVDVHFANIPDSDPITKMLMKSLVQAMDEWHSLTSREKGMAGMAENVRQGFRGAGPAPLGYRLRRVDIGIVRDGAAVTKSVLEPTDDAPRVQRYLLLRIQGIPRASALHSASLQIPNTSALTLEWNALTYAGCTTLHVFHERHRNRGYKGGRKRRPRSEWMVQPDTHPALITREQAEQLISALERSTHGEAVRQARSGKGGYLLSGMLRTPTGEAWEGSEHKYYRSRGDRHRHVPCAALDDAVMQHLTQQTQSIEFARALCQHVQSAAPRAAEPLKRMQARIAQIATQIDKAQTYMLEAEEPASWVRKIDALERERQQLATDLADAKEDAELHAASARISPEAVLQLMRDQTERLLQAPLHDRRALVQALIESIELDPTTLDCAVRWRWVGGEINRDKVVLPRKRAAIPVYVTAFRVPHVDGRTLRWRRMRAA